MTGIKNENKPPRADKDSIIVLPKITIRPIIIIQPMIISTTLDSIHELISPMPLFFSPPEMTIV